MNYIPCSLFVICAKEKVKSMFVCICESFQRAQSMHSTFGTFQNFKLTMEFPVYFSLIFFIIPKPGVAKSPHDLQKISIPAFLLREEGEHFSLSSLYISARFYEPLIFSLLYLSARLNFV
jgi:hypothetical protein